MIAYAKEHLEVSLESRAVWRSRCQELSRHAQHVTHYLKSLIQPDRFAANLGPDLHGLAWPLWVRDRAEVAVKRFMRSKA